MTKLKKMALGLLVAVLAVGFSAFTEKSVKSDTYTFYYDGPFPATVSDVEDVNNWKHDAASEECSGALQMACSITIDKNYVDDTNPAAPILDASAALQATAFGTNAAYVSGSADGSIVIANRLQ